VSFTWDPRKRLCSLALNPAVDILTRKPPASADLKRRHLLGSGEPVDCSLSYLEILGDFLDRENSTFDRISRHVVTRVTVNMFIIVQNFQCLAIVNFAL